MLSFTFHLVTKYDFFVLLFAFWVPRKFIQECCQESFKVGVKNTTFMGQKKE